MKIITNNAAYVQFNDIAYLNSSYLPIPASVFIKVFGDGLTIINNKNRYDFIKFDEEEEIKFFKALDWMIDYNDIKDLSEEEMKKLGESILQEREEIATRFNLMDDSERMEHTDMIIQCDLLDFKFDSLRDFLWYKQGYIRMELPEEYINDRNK